jgi:hypothetical protein
VSDLIIELVSENNRSEVRRLLDRARPPGHFPPLVQPFGPSGIASSSLAPEKRPLVRNVLLRRFANNPSQRNLLLMRDFFESPIEIRWKADGRADG